MRHDASAQNLIYTCNPLGWKNKR